MANYSTLKAAVADVVKTNGTRAITGANLQAVLLSIINSVGGGYIFKGVATPSTNAGTPDENVFYLGGAGTYANFGTSITVPVGSICVFKYNGSWVKEQIALFAGIDDVPTANSNNLVKSGGVYNDIQGLDGQINGYNEETPITATYSNGYINGANGVIAGTVSSTYQHTDAIEITDDMVSLRCYAYLSDTTLGGVGFYKSDILPTNTATSVRTVEVIGYNTGSVTTDNEIINISAEQLADLKSRGAKYFSVCVLSSGTRGITYFTPNYGIVGDMEALNTRVDNVEENINTLSQSIDGKIEDAIVLEDEVTNYGLYTSTQTGKLYDSDGSLIDNPYYNSSTLALLDKDHDIYPYLTANESRTYVVYFDKNKQFISRVQGFNSNHPALKSTFPATAKYVAFSWVLDSLLSDTFATRNAYIRMMGWKVYCTIKKRKGERPTIDILPTDAQGDILVKLCNAYIAGDCDVKFNFGEYNFQSIYTDMVSTYEVGNVQGSWQRELPLGRNCVYDLCNSTITGSLPTGVSDAKIFGNMRTAGEDYKLMNGKIVNNGMVYAIHDEGQNAEGFYLHEYKNLEIVNNGGTAAIGLGTGQQGVVNVDKCVFLDNDATKSGIAGHGITDSSVTASAVFELNITNCWFSTTAKATTLGVNQTAKFAMSGCSVTSLNTTSTWDKYFFCNDVRS